MRTALLLVSLSGTLSAQQTWVVDLANGPGTDFLDLPAAVSAAAAGDVILVRDVPTSVGVYTGTLIDKSLTVMGVGGQPFLKGSVQVGLLPAGQHVVLRDLQLAPFDNPPSVFFCHLVLANNEGSVHLQNVDRPAVPTPTVTLFQTQIFDSRTVTMTDCDLAIYGVANVTGSTVTMNRCTMFPASTIWSTVVNLQATDLTLLDSTVSGPGPFVGGQIAIGGCDSTVRVSGTSVVDNGSGIAINTLSSGLCTGGLSLQVDPAAVAGNVGVVGTADWMPALGVRTDSSFVMHLAGQGEPFSTVFLVLGTPAPNPAALPPFVGLAHLDPVGAVLLAPLPTDGAGLLAAQVQLPNNLPTGASAWLQGVSLGSMFGTRLTGPAVVVVP